MNVKVYNCVANGSQYLNYICFEIVQTWALSHLIYRIIDNISKFFILCFIAKKLRSKFVFSSRKVTEVLTQRPFYFKEFTSYFHPRYRISLNNERDDTFHIPT